MWLERWRRQDQVSNSVTALDAAIFGAKVAGDACIFARVEVDAAIFGLCEGSPTRVRHGQRGHYLDACREADARMMWPTRVSLGRVQGGRRAYPPMRV